MHKNILLVFSTLLSINAWANFTGNFRGEYFNANSKCQVDLVINQNIKNEFQILNWNEECRTTTGSIESSKSEIVTYKKISDKLMKIISPGIELVVAVEKVVIDDQQILIKINSHVKPGLYEVTTEYKLMDEKQIQFDEVITLNDNTESETHILFHRIF